MFNNPIAIIMLVVTLLTMSQQYVFAHGEGGTFEVSKDGYFIDIGYSPEYVQAERRVRFDFIAYDESTISSQEELFDSVWVRLEKEEEVVFSGNLSRPSFGPTGFATILPSAGMYKVYARFQKDEQMVTDAEFLLKVNSSTTTTKQQSDNWIDLQVFVPLILLLGVAIVGLLYRYRFKK